MIIYLGFVIQPTGMRQTSTQVIRLLGSSKIQT